MELRDLRSLDFEVSPQARREQLFGFVEVAPIGLAPYCSIRRRPQAGDLGRPHSSVIVVRIGRASRRLGYDHEMASAVDVEVAPELPRDSRRRGDHDLPTLGQLQHEAAAHIRGNRRHGEP